MFWTGIVLSVLPALLLLFSAVIKFIKPAGFAEGLAHGGLDLSLANGLGVLEIVCTVLYLIPCTAILGAILLTGYLGGAILCCLRVGDPYYMQFVLGVILWGGLFLREPRLRALIPLRK